MSDDLPENPDKEPPKRVKLSKIELVGGGVDLPPGLAGALGQLFGGVAAAPKALDADAPAQNIVKTLRSLYASICDKQSFELGDIVRFKPGLNHTRISGVGIFSGYLDEPVRSGADTSTPMFCDLADCFIGVVVNEGHYFEYPVDSRRLERVPEAELDYL